MSTRLQSRANPVIDFSSKYLFTVPIFTRLIMVFCYFTSRIIKMRSKLQNTRKSRNFLLTFNLDMYSFQWKVCTFVWFSVVESRMIYMLEQVILE